MSPFSATGSWGGRDSPGAGAPPGPRVRRTPLGAQGHVRAKPLAWTSEEGLPPGRSGVLPDRGPCRVRRVLSGSSCRKAWSLLSFLVPRAS